MTHYIRFPDEATGMAYLRDADLTYMDEDGEYEVERVFTASHRHALDVIGVITTGGTWDPETGDQLTPPEILDGWHVNYLGDLPDGWDAYVVEPKRPKRVFA